jgi:predicted glycoside hydrolase/deacetylase ChbG (UPF0249 family)
VFDDPVQVDLMIIINADDWGRCGAETDAALACHREGRVTSVSAMVFMQDSERAAELAKEHAVDVGLHLNLSQRYNGGVAAESAVKTQDRIVRFMKASKYAVLLYQPFLRKQFRDVYQDQVEEFTRLYGKPPSHVDGHQHRHLCANVLLGDVIPRGQKVRRNFSFISGEKGLINRGYRGLVDGLLRRRYQLTDFFFSLGDCLRSQSLGRVIELARTANVELMTHPVHAEERAFLLSDEYAGALKGLSKGSYAALCGV